jgi:predicted dienelactone hydrolase
MSSRFRCTAASAALRAGALALSLASAPLAAAPQPPRAAYDPLALASASDGAVRELVVEAGERDLPVRVYLPPSGAQAAPVVLFSHGLGGSRAGSAYLGKHWSARGYAAVFLQHPGSDEAIWQGVAPEDRLEALEDAATPRNFMNRAEDVGRVLDALETWTAKASGHELSGRLDLARVGMSGHSFGALTTQAVSGQSVPLAGDRFVDARVRAAVVMSPGKPRRGSVEDAFREVKIPWLLMTGTHDDAPIGGATAATRLAVFPALPAGHKYELVLDGAEHSAFTERALRGETRPRNPNHHRAVLALTTAFWDAYLRSDAAARAWLDGDGPRGVLEPKDRWQRK